MKLRTYFFLFLFLFGMAPLLTAVVINLPFLMERLEQFYHKSHVQNLRADFRDLDLHLDSCQEATRILARLMEPGTGSGGGKQPDARDKDDYAALVRKVLQDKLDITRVVTVDRDYNVKFWMERDPNGGWTSSKLRPDILPYALNKEMMQMEPEAVLVSPVLLRNSNSLVDSTQRMTMYMLSPLMVTRGSQRVQDGVIVLSIDIRAMARMYKDTIWASSSGSYISPPLHAGNTGSAFDDFPGLERIFAGSKMALWDGGASQVIWTPLLETDKSDFIWAGREVEPSPVSSVRSALILRLLSTIIVVIIIVVLMARWYARRVSGFGHDLTDGITRLLKNEDTVVFEWDGPQELHQLGRYLNRLAKVFTGNVQELREHACELEETNRYKSEFLANVSHELRTPLNSILLLSKMLSDPESGLSPKQAEKAKVIYEAGVGLRTLIDDILDISRIEAQEVNFNLSQFSIPGLVDELIELMRPQFDETGLDLAFEQDGDATQIITSDRDKLAQVLRNFLSNAVKFTEKGGVVIRLHRNDRSDAATRPIAISVEDSGIGIPVHKLSVIFGAFKQVDGSTSRRFGGTGLGLTISRDLAELMGGRIVLWSKEGEGSIFTVLLPLEFDPLGTESEYVEEQPVEPAAVDQSVDQPVEPLLADRIFASGCILIMDPEIDNLLTLTPLLEAWGLQVVEDLKELPIIAMMSEQSEQHYREAMEAGVNGVIAKPVKAAELQEILVHYLKTV
ncbi:MAG: ATP-binding protein [Gammaproteobacteria bacterium]